MVMFCGFGFISPEEVSVAKSGFGRTCAEVSMRRANFPVAVLALCLGVVSIGTVLQNLYSLKTTSTKFQGAREDGFDTVEAFPTKQSSYQESEKPKSIQWKVYRNENLRNFNS